MKSDRSKVIVFIVPSLKAGGAERVVSFLMNSFNKKDKFQCTLIVVGYPSDDVYKIDDASRLIHLNRKRVLYAIIPLLKLIRKIKPNVIMTSIGHLNTLMGFFTFLFPKIQFIAREASVIGVSKKFNRKGFIPHSAVKYLYNRLDIILCQSRDMAEDMVNEFNIDVDKLTVINNPISTDFPLKRNNTFEEPLKLITVGRLNQVKGHERLILILSKLNITFTYTLIGSGPEEENLNYLINNLGLADKIIHIPYTKEVGKYLAQSDLYMQGSYVEGFPNALLESCTVGTPVLAFKAPGGTREIIQNGINGYIVNSEEDFIQKINEFKKQKWDPENIRQSVYTKFEKSKILQEYENLFLSLIP